MLENVRITVVDNFQGEESKIILLSLVRSNEESRIGYLGTQNRICVALSRAKHGLYIIGNMSNLKSKSTVWQNINENLQKQEAIGDSLTLFCQIHGVETKVKNGKDFKVLKNGGCTALCPMSSSKLSCGHPCQKLCHPSDTDHKYYQCPLPCLRTKCENPARHACPNPCHYECSPCVVEVPKFVPSCGHTVKIPCSQSPRMFNCNFMVEKTPPCGHTQPIACSYVLKYFFCMKDCTKTHPGCRHKCVLKCGFPCGDCTVMVDRTLRCGHIQRVECFRSDPACLVRCDRDLPCGHKCSKLCHSGSCVCSLMVQTTLEKCGHVIIVPCSNKDSDLCTERCRNKLDCDHYCKYQCGHSTKECCCHSSCKKWKKLAASSSVYGLKRASGSRESGLWS